MKRYKLSRLFSRYAEKFMPGDRFLGASATELMNDNRNHYRDQLIEGLQTLFSKFDSGLVLESKNTGVGKAIIKLSSPQKYPGYYPAEFALTTESSDFLRATGRIAAFAIRHEDGKEKIFYYGNARNTDNKAQLMGLPAYLADVNVIARHLHSETFAALYARYEQGKSQRRGRPPVIAQIDGIKP